MSTSSIRERLALDHFYIPASADELGALSKMTSGLRDSSYSRIVSGDDHWEGVYIPSRTGDYFEIVHYPRAAPLGLAFSPAKPQYTDARKLAKEFPALAWKRGSRLTDTHQPWFDWLSLSDDADPTFPPIKAWAMHYHFTHWPQSTTPSGPRVIDRFKRVELILGRDIVPSLRALVPWIPGSQRWGDGKIALVLPLRDGHELLIDIRLKDGDERLSFLSLEMEITRGQDIAPGKFGPFELAMTAAHTAVFRKL